MRKMIFGSEETRTAAARGQIAEASTDYTTTFSIRRITKVSMNTLKQ